MSWNHRVIKHKDKKHGDWFAIHEVFYDDKDIPIACTENPIQIIQEKVDDLEWEIELIKKATDKPVLDYSYFEKLGKKKGKDNENKSGKPRQRKDNKKKD